MNYVKHNGIPFNERMVLMQRTNEEKFKDTGKLHAFYGSLRKGQYNAQSEDEGYKFIKTTTIKGWKMYSLHAYPAVTRSENKEDSIVVDLFEITNKGRAAGIYNMELGATYFLDSETIEGKKYSIYRFSEEWENNRPVPSGDWVKLKASEAKKSQELRAVS